MISHEHAAHEEWVARLRPALAGKRVFLTTINVNTDWLLKTALEVGMEIVYLCVMNYLHTPVKITDHPELFPAVDDNYDWTKLPEYIAQTKPDIVLSNYTAASAEGNYLVDAVPMIPRIGFNSALHVFERWANLFETKREGAWKNDRALFEKYFS